MSIVQYFLLLQPTQAYTAVLAGNGGPRVPSAYQEEFEGEVEVDTTEYGEAKRLAWKAHWASQPSLVGEWEPVEFAVYGLNGEE